MNKIIKFFFNIWYRFFPPEAVSYWKTQDTARAKIIVGEGGAMNMQIEGEKYAYPGFPRGHVLMGLLGRVKHKIKQVFNTTRGEMQELIDKYGNDLMPPEKMCPAVKELWRAFIELENAEITEDMKARVRLWRDVTCFLFQEDDAYRWRFLWMLERLDMKKMRLTKQDRYFFRGKYFKVDHTFRQGLLRKLFGKNRYGY